MKAAVFFDRDGTLIEDKDYLSRPEDLIMIPGAATALKSLQDAGFWLFMVTNQSGIGRGYFTMAEVDRIHEHLASFLNKEGVRLQKIYVAPEAPGAPSHGRKPSPQFLFDAREEFGIDLASSYMVGDKSIDLECGWNAAVRKSVLVRTGHGAHAEQEHAAAMARAVVVDDISTAATWILKDAGKT